MIYIQEFQLHLKLPLFLPKVYVMIEIKKEENSHPTYYDCDCSDDEHHAEGNHRSDYGWSDEDKKKKGLSYARIK